MVGRLLFLEQEKEINDRDLPYSPEFREGIREEYARRVMGVTPDPAIQTNEEEESGSEEVDEISAGDSEPGD